MLDHCTPKIVQKRFERQPWLRVGRLLLILLVAWYTRSSRPQRRGKRQLPSKGEIELSRIPLRADIFCGAHSKKFVMLFVLLGSTFNFDIAMADSVNGKWCSLGEKHFEISYEEVTLSDGTEVDGDYDAHHYVFRMPPIGDSGDTTVDLVLVRQDVIHVRFISDSGIELLPQPEKWTRCEPGVS